MSTTETKPEAPERNNSHELCRMPTTHVCWFKCEPEIDEHYHEPDWVKAHRSALGFAIQLISEEIPVGSPQGNLPAAPHVKAVLNALRKAMDDQMYMESTKSGLPFVHSNTTSDVAERIAEKIAAKYAKLFDGFETAGVVGAAKQITTIIQSELASGQQAVCDHVLNWRDEEAIAKQIVAEIAESDCLTCKHWSGDAVFSIAQAIVKLRAELTQQADADDEKLWTPSDCEGERHALNCPYPTQRGQLKGQRITTPDDEARARESTEDDVLDWYNEARAKAVEVTLAEFKAKYPQHAATLSQFEKFLDRCEEPPKGDRNVSTSS